MDPKAPSRDGAIFLPFFNWFVTDDLRVFPLACNSCWVFSLVCNPRWGLPSCIKLPRPNRDNVDIIYIAFVGGDVADTCDIISSELPLESEAGEGQRA